ncbi:alkaline phosphatase, tissue-nonspecific isozyme-like [Mya arenaria]|uniref:alkaline phosphatase, tissue-nonspecific isozyme-like n=1 Tax=Mya arenaria TaxID=6604 RepID=UPI0022E01D87|nr:alkaline phosphatase, tissue-nonspecific isozyme-like [Mya arenaria]
MYPTEVRDATFYQNAAKKDLLNKLRNRENKRVAKNIILFIGDGMGMSTVTAARIRKGQLEGYPGEETVLNFERFPYVGLSKVYCEDVQVPDSACTATALFTGVKTNFEMLRLDASTSLNDSCVDPAKGLPGLLQWSQAAGKSTGIVTTSRMTHATPAAMYAVATNRDWETDTLTPAGCIDIADQLITLNSDINVILGGGSSYFIPSDGINPVTNINDSMRTDDKDLIQAWIDDKEAKDACHSVAYNTEQLQAIDANYKKYILGLFSSNHMDYELDRDKTPMGQPSIAEMTKTAIQSLSNDEDGFFLMVEGARIDLAHHKSYAKKAIHDVLAFEEAIQVALERTNPKDTLIIVTADHSHTMTISGSPRRGNAIFEADDYQYEALIERKSETHSGEDVAIYALGPMAHLFTGVMEQNVISYAMAHAACIGDIGIDCKTGRKRNSNM